MTTATKVATVMHSAVLGDEYVKLTDQITLALCALPRRGRQEALRKLAEVLAEHRLTGDVSGVDHLVESLVMTARMNARRDYKIAMATVESPDEPRDIADVIAMLEAGADEPGTQAA